MDPLYDEGTIDAVRTVKGEAVALAELLALDSQSAIARWQQELDTRLLPRLLPDFPLVAAICGGGSSGKSTLFNTLVGESVSPTGGRAGINRRLLMAINATHRKRPGFAEALFEPLGCLPRQMTRTDQLTTPGDPLLHYADTLPTGLTLVDTPDFDTGFHGSYQNREMAEQSLRVADVLIYIFTNANYNNRDNTDFMARMLTAVGTRKCFLVYRVYPSFTDEEILDHAGTVARNLYGDLAQQHVLGIYRADEDNRVAAGRQPMAIAPVGDGRSDLPDLKDALARMDPRRIRGELHRSIFRDVLEQGRQFLTQARESKAHLVLYLESLSTVQRRSVQEALGHLPMDAVVRRFSQIWQATDPSHIRIMRKTGQVVETPLKLMVRAAKWISGSSPRKNGSVDGDTATAMEFDLVRASNHLRQSAVDPEMVLQLSATDPSAETLRELAHRLGKQAAIGPRTDAGQFRIQVPLHPALARAQADLRNQNWSLIIQDMLARQEALLGLTDQLESELRRLADEQRARMTTFDQIRQTFSALLNVIPATAAVTYVLHTGDPVGAVGIKVKLAGIFGLHDLYALVAIPATAGMKKADLKQLEALLGPVAQAWLTHKLTAIEGLFEEKITGSLFKRGREVAESAVGRIAALAESLARCDHALEKRP